MFKSKSNKDNSTKEDKKEQEDSNDAQKYKPGKYKPGGFSRGFGLSSILPSVGRDAKTEDNSSTKDDNADNLTVTPPLRPSVTPKMSSSHSYAGIGRGASPAPYVPGGSIIAEKSKDNTKEESTKENPPKAKEIKTSAKEASLDAKKPDKKETKTKTETKNIEPKIEKETKIMTSPTATPTSPTIPQGNRDDVRKLVVGKDITLSGEISACDHLVVEGTVDAKLKDAQSIEIIEGGSFHGKVDLESAEISGLFDGDITVKGRLSIRGTGIVKGRIQCGELQVDLGGKLIGEMSVGEPLEMTQLPLGGAAGKTLGKPLGGDSKSKSSSKDKGLSLNIAS